MMRTDRFDVPGPDGLLARLLAAAVPRSGRRSAPRRLAADAERPRRLIPGSPHTSTSWSRSTPICTPTPSSRARRSRRRSGSPSELTKAGATVTTNVGKLGVVGVLKNGDGPVVLVRTDMDALPVVEETGLALRQHGQDPRQGRPRRRRDARLRPRHPHDQLHRHGPLAGRPSRPLVGHGRPGRPAGRGGRRRRPRRCSRTVSTPGFPSPISPWPCTAGPTSRSARSRYCSGPDARQLDLGRRSRFAARAATAPGRTARSTRSSWPPWSSSTSRRSSAARSSRASRRS